MGDMHVCPQVTPGLPPIPHVGGPIMPPGEIMVMAMNAPLAAVGGMCVCVGPPDSIISGSIGVLSAGKMIARMGDSTAHGGTIVIGAPTVMIGDMSPAQVVTIMNGILLELNAGGGTINCAHIVKSAADFLQGKGISAAPTVAGGNINNVNARLGTNVTTSTTTTFSTVFSDLEAAGPGNSTVVVILRPPPAIGHVVVVANVDGEVGVMEGQGGQGFINDEPTATNLYDPSGNNRLYSDSIPH